ncbi:MAG: methyltransferase domain-containing protein [Alphaproteobacteria bacterium]|nr:methyltransferase domain-containing protein [Alphaproteobacteria bacterium]
MDIEKQVNDYYAKISDQYETGQDDELHIGQHKATEYFASLLNLSPGMHVLDIGSGLGKSARFIARAYNVHIDGLDISPDFCQKARALTEHETVQFHEGSATNMPFENETFDAAYTMHVCMNIPDKEKTYAETHRVLKAGAVFGIYDVMAGNSDESELPFPLPWALTGDTSFLSTPDETCDALQNAGFEISYQENRRDFALTSLELALSNNLDENLRKQLSNLRQAIKTYSCAPEIIVCKRI